MDFDTEIDRRGTHSAKWDAMEQVYGVSPNDGLAMWVADMDFRPPQVVRDALTTMAETGVYGYFGDDTAYKDAIIWWMQNRHGWQVQPEEIFSTHGLVNGTAICLDAFSQSGDGIVLFSPVYHVFAKLISAAGRVPVDCEMQQVDGRYTLDFERYDAQMTGNETMLILCSPHNPGGRVWTRAELNGIAAFARRHGLIIVSDEIHHDLTMPGQTHIPMAHIEGIADRLIMMSGTTKTFNIAGSHIGNVIIADPDLRAKFNARMLAAGMSPNAFGMNMATAAYSPDGAVWVDELRQYLADNAKLFDAGIAAIPGLRSMSLEATYLSWVDFSDTGMSVEEFTARVEKTAKIAVNHGTPFGAGGETFLRFNIGTTRARVAQATQRLAAAFSDLQ
ncbi:MAG: pyridoxal phosphate-dependent aminotransferase [Rhodobacteraceae bacterium]|nr:pyridoxal phosphate-dependent aminotransferase [Paracoccaceae bacterium]